MFDVCCTARFSTIIIIKQHQHFDSRFTFVRHALFSPSPNLSHSVSFSLILSLTLSLSLSLAIPSLSISYSLSPFNFSLLFGFDRRVVEEKPHSQSTFAWCACVCVHSNSIHMQTSSKLISLMWTTECRHTFEVLIAHSCCGLHVCMCVTTSEQSTSILCETMWWQIV